VVVLAYSDSWVVPPTENAVEAEKTRRDALNVKRDKLFAQHLKFPTNGTLTDEHGDEVKLEKGGRVAVTVTAEEKHKGIEKT
jgi:hypothetical protein